MVDVSRKRSSLVTMRAHRPAFVAATSVWIPIQITTTVAHAGMFVETMRSVRVVPAFRQLFRAKRGVARVRVVARNASTSSRMPTTAALVVKSAVTELFAMMVHANLLAFAMLDKFVTQKAFVFRLVAVSPAKVTNYAATTNV